MHACVDYTVKMLRSTCSVRLTKQLLLSAMQDQGDPEVLWQLLVDLALISLSGLHSGSRAGLLAFWQEQENETASGAVPMEGAACALQCICANIALHAKS